MVKYDKASVERGSRYVEDRRGAAPRSRSSMPMGAGAGGGLPMGKVGGLGGIIVLLITMFLGGGSLLDGGGSSSAFDLGGPGAAPAAPLDPANDPDAETVELMKALMFDIQDTWDKKFTESGRPYDYTSMVIFSGAVSTGCGQATSAVGPFYCPAPGDNKVYIDLDFYDELATRFAAPGDFAQAYVIAHEVGHHIQSVTGISDQVRQAQGNDPRNKNYYSVRQELQADCFAGVWAHEADKRSGSASGVRLQINDLEEGLAAAAAVGDDRIQSQAGMSVDPHTWTHGSSSQRQAWFMEGYNSGDPEMCNTFNRNIAADS